MEFPSINFGNCYNNLKNVNNITQDLITVVVNKNDVDNENNGKSYISYSFFNPNTGEKLDTDIFKNDIILVEQNILSLLNENMPYYQELKSLLEQGINIFDKNDLFYTDICYDYNLNSTKDRDIALQDRTKLFYPNISLCDSDCTQNSVDLINYTAICECQFNDISSDNKKEKQKGENLENILMENLIGDILELLSSSNIKVGKCASKSLNSIKDSYGAYITILLFVISLICTIAFYSSELNKIKLFIYNNLEKYMIYINLKSLVNESPPKKNEKRGKRH